MSRFPLSRPLLLSALVLPLATLHRAQAQPVAKLSAPTRVVLSSPQKVGVWLQIEAVGPKTVRLWYSRSPKPSRPLSEAMRATQIAAAPLKSKATASGTQITAGETEINVDKMLRVSIRDLRTGQAESGALGVDEFRADGSWTLTQNLRAGERLMGLGQDNASGGRLDRRGTIRELWAGQQINSGNVTAQYPIPFLVGLNPNGSSYGVFLDNTYRLKYDLGKTDPDRLKLDAPGGEADFYVVGGPSMKDVVTQYTALTGRPSLPPLWALAYWQSRCVFYNWNDIDNAYEQLNKRGYPVDAMVIDYNWPLHMNDFEWDTRWSTPGKTPGQKVADYARKGVKIVMSNSGPMIRKDSPTYEPGWKQGVFATDGKGNPVEAGYYGGQLLDFTSPTINSWLWPQVSKRAKEGVAGWWLDLTEPEGEPPQTVYKGGKSADIHNQFSLLATKSFEGVQRAVTPNRRPFILTRAGSAGIQAHNAALWSGDIYSDYPTFRAHAPEMLNSGLSGITWWTCDTGGFMSGFYKDDQFGAHARLYERWMQFSVFSPITRAHKSGLCMPYEFGPATEQSTKHYLNLRYQLLPYIYSYAWQAHTTGVPMVRPMVMEFPADAQAKRAGGDQYMFGEQLLVAPVLREGVSNRKVNLPAGQWINFDDGSRYTGGREWVVAAPQNRIPVLVRAGAIIPMAPPMKNTQQGGNWRNLVVEVFPSGTSHFDLYKDDGDTIAFEKGKAASTSTQFTSIATPNQEKFTIRASNRAFAATGYTVQFHLDKKPGQVSINGKIGTAKWDAKTGVCAVKVDARGSLNQEITLRNFGAATPRPLAPTLVADVPNESSPTVGKPTPHFFPSPQLPNRLRAANYDNGGEGVGFHLEQPAKSSPYRTDNAGLIETDDAGGGYAVNGLKAGEWLRYTVDAPGGGLFDLSVRMQGAGRFRLISADREVAVVESSGTGWHDIKIPAVYLLPGEDSLLMLVERGGFRLNSLDFQRTINPQIRTEAEWARRAGQAASDAGAGGTAGFLKNVGQRQGEATWGVFSAQGGAMKLRLRLANGSKALRNTLRVNDGTATEITLPNTGGGANWQNFEVPIEAKAGWNKISLSWNVESYDSASLDWLEIAP